MNADNKVSMEPQKHEVGSPPAELAATPNVSPAINGEAYEQQERQTKKAADNELVTSQMYEPNLITDQESAVKEPPNSAEQPDEPKEPDKNLKEEEVADVPHELTVYGLPVEQDCPNIVKHRR